MSDPRFELNILIAEDGELFPYTREAAAEAHVREILVEALEACDPDKWDAEDELKARAKQEAVEIQTLLDKGDLKGAWHVFRYGGENCADTSQVRGMDGWRWEVHQCVRPEGCVIAERKP